MRTANTIKLYRVIEPMERNPFHDSSSRAIGFSIFLHNRENLPARYLHAHYHNAFCQFPRFVFIIAAALCLLLLFFVFRASRVINRYTRAATIKQKKKQNFFFKYNEGSATGRRHGIRAVFICELLSEDDGQTATLCLTTFWS